MAELQDGLPPGWDCKVDYKTGKQYYINHYTKTTTWEDPRGRHRYHGAQTSHSEYIPLQHGSPDLRRNSVYPSHPSPIPAFQMPGQYSPKFIPLQEMRSMSPLSIRTAKVQDSSFTTVPDTDESVMKISSLFPTVSDTHIRLLLKKYHNREAVVISALQVEKHPIMTPGPFSTPPPSRNAPLQMTPPAGLRGYSRTGSPIFKTTSCANSTYTGSPRVGDAHRNSPRPHSSPKLKLRYMKSIFPEAEETIILDVLSNNDNNIQKTSESLKDMGFSRKETVIVKQPGTEPKSPEQKAREEAHAKLHPPPVVPVKIKTTQEKFAIKTNLQDSYKDIPEHVISMALDSVHYNEERANQILEIMVQEDKKMKESTDRKIEEDEAKVAENTFLTVPTSVTTSQSRQSLKSLLKEKPDNNKVSFSRVIEENNMNNSDYKSTNLSNTHGSNPDYAKGANEKLLLEDYIKWQGPNPTFRSGPNKTLANGPNKDLLSGKAYKVHGANAELQKGPKFGLAKGSIFSQFKCIVGGESRGK